MSETSEILEALAGLRPYDVNVGKRRIGSDGDGGYVLADIIPKTAALLSFGIGDNCDFELEFANHGHDVVMFDPTIAHPPAGHPRFVFHRLALGGRDDRTGGVVALASALELANLQSHTDVVLKCDIEGAEYDAFEAVPEELLGRFSQIVLELHDLDRLGIPEQRARLTALTRAINKRFVLFHIHANNCAAIALVGGASFAGHHLAGAVPVPAALELSFVRSDLVSARPSRTVYPSALDRPNYHLCPDHLLNFFPFSPWQREDIAMVIGSATTRALTRASPLPAPRRILVDVASVRTFAIQGHTLTGIQRVELRLARELVKYGGIPVFWDESGLFRTVDLNVVERRLQQAPLEIDKILAEPRRTGTASPKELRELRLQVALFPLVPKIGSLRRRFALRVITRFAKLYLEFDVEERQRIARKLKLQRRFDRKNAFIAAKEPSITNSAPFEPRGDDLLLLASNLPSQPCMDYIEARAIQIAPLIYDLYVFTHPHLMTHYVEVKRSIWTSTLPRYARNARMLIACSENTRRELLNWFKANGLEEPRVGCVPLAPGLDRSSACAAPREFPFPPGRFVLLVGSFCPNKNQAWAHMLWSRVIAAIGDRTLPLVLAGRDAWYGRDTIQGIMQDLHYGKHLLIVESPSDSELGWLYANCAFVIQPSETEGWGLPVSEALAFGKPCLTSGRGALAESGQGVAWEADPIDGKRWLDKVCSLMTDPSALEAERERTRTGVRTRTWADVAADIRTVLLDQAPV
jgi:glycosyltransferase involved in cell wall biosynthesis